MQRQKAKDKRQKAKVLIRKASPHPLAHRTSAFIESLRSNPNLPLPFAFCRLLFALPHLPWT
jgi:hypothetical protein